MGVGVEPPEEVETEPPAAEVETESREEVESREEIV